MTALKTNQQIQTGVAAKDFSVKDVNGKLINLSDYRGKKLLLFFSRSVGCPICNLRFNQLQSTAEWFKENNFSILMISESSPEVMKQYLAGVEPYPVMIPNPDQSLYKLYQIERSFGKVFKGLFNGLIDKGRKGMALYEQKIPMDGNKDRMEAEFLIDEKGTVVQAHYAQYLGDEIPLEDIKAFAKRN